ncbi:radical SAM protein, partial [Planctomycetota bacterium]
SSSNYPFLRELVAALRKEFDGLNVDISLPSLRIDDQLGAIPAMVSGVRRSGLTMAPETGTDRMRRIINKDISDEHLFEAARNAYAAGYDRIKLYLMIGNPGETEEDILAGLRLAEELSYLRKECGKPPAFINVGLATLVPKPHTPFQWSPMPGRENLEGAIRLLMDRRKNRRVHFRYNSVDGSFLEGVLALGDARVGKAIYRAWELGAFLDPWDEFFSYERWQQAFAGTGIDPAFYIHRQKPYDEFLPWQHIFAGVSTEFLEREMRKTENGQITENCMYGKCQACGTDCELPLDLWEINGVKK